MNSRRKLAAVGAGAILTVGALGAPSAKAQAPDGTAEAVAAAVGDIVAVGHTVAKATPTEGSATANAVEVGGEPLIPDTTGGTQTGKGKKSGSLIDTGEAPVRVEVTPWSAEVGDDGACRTSTAAAALARLTIEGLLGVNVLQSTSTAQHCGATSKGSGSSDGVTVDLGDGALQATILHSEAASGADAGAYLVGINGNEIGSSEQAGGGCALEVPELLNLTCLTATGGQDVVSAAVAEVAALGGALTADIVKTGAIQGGTAPAPRAEPPITPRADTGTLPRTGGDSFADAIRGIAMLLCGIVMLVAARMRAAGTPLLVRS